MTRQMTRIALTLTCLLTLGVGAWAREDQPVAKKGTHPVAHQDAKAKAVAARVRARAKAKAAADAKLVDINSATKEQLAKIPGLNEALAQQIIAHRPYLTKEHLVLNKALPEGLFFSIRNRVIARQPGVKVTPVRKSVIKK